MPITRQINYSYLRRLYGGIKYLNIDIGGTIQKKIGSFLRGKHNESFSIQ